MSNQIEMISLEDLVPITHQYRKFIDVFDFVKIKHHFKTVEKDANYKGYGVDRLFRCLLLQFMENISSIRSPGESVFSKQRRRVRYCGIAKNQFAEFMNAICFNMRRILVLEKQLAG